MFGRSAELAPEDEALKGGSCPMLENPKPRAVLGTPITDPWEDGQEVVCIGTGYYWGAEKLSWGISGMLSMSVELAGDVTPNPTYRESCTGRANHTETVEVVYNPEQINFGQSIVKASETHNPTRGYRQDNDANTQYRFAVYTTTPEQARRAQEIADVYASKLADVGLSAITTEIKPLSKTPVREYYRAEGEHQRYLFKNPNGHYPVHSTGVACRI